MRSIKDQDTNKNVLVIKLNQFQSCQGNQAVNSIISRLTTDRIIATITDPLSLSHFPPDSDFEPVSRIIFCSPIINYCFSPDNFSGIFRKNCGKQKKTICQNFPENRMRAKSMEAATKKYGKVWKQLQICFSKSMEAATPWNPFLENVLKLDRLMQFRFKWTKHFPMKYICHHLLRTYPAAQTGLVVKNHMQSSFF